MLKAPWLLRASRACLALGLAATFAASPVVADTPGTVSASTWPAPRLDAEDGPRRYARGLTGTFGGRQLRYSALLEETIVRDRNGSPASNIFSTAFVVHGKTVPARPVIFIFNGGPGGASNALMFGAMGPQRMTSFTAAAQADPAVGLTANDSAVLDVADLIFYDPPETGFGRPLPGSDPKTFRSNDADSFAAAQFILHWLSRHDRLDAPVYLVGESYGTHRAVMLARDLRAASPSINVAGLVLVSQGLTYNGPPDRAIRRLPDPLRAIVRLHDVVPLAWYHGLIDNRGQTLAQAVTAAIDFERGEYAAAILAGNRRSAERRARVAAKLATLTGLPASYFLENDLRIVNARRDLLAARGLALGQFDGRETEPLNRVVADADRDWEKAFAGLTGAMERFTRQVFGATGLPPYRSIVPDPYGFEESWRYIEPPQPGLDVVLAEQLQVNSRLKVMFTFGVFDTTSSMGATELLVGQLSTGPDRVGIRYYPGGHMVYSDDGGRAAFNADIRAFVTGGMPADGALPNIVPSPR